MAKIRIKNAGKIIAWVIRLFGLTLRIELRDLRDGFAITQRGGCMWAFWHNRTFLIPWLHHRWFPSVPGAILTSPSGDGQIIADVCASFGYEAARGSSSKPQKGMSALIGLAEKLRSGRNVGITPDGPRGPKYQIQPGIIKLGQLTGAAIIPVQVDYSRALRFRTWDAFLLPLPFCTVTITLHPALTIPRRLSEEEFEQHRAALESTLRAGVS